MDARRENLPLTALRGLAAVWVVLHHTQPLLFPDAPAGVAARLLIGRSAVDVFFVLSGFILASLYGAMPLSAAPLFWLRRMCRVYPLHLAVMAALAAMAVATTLLHVNRSTHDWPTFPLVLTLLQPFVPGSASWNAPSWSVGIELACYALFPYLAQVFRRLPIWAVACVALALAVSEAAVLRKYGGAVEGHGALLRGLCGFYLGATLGAVAPPLGSRLAPTISGAGVVGVGAGLWLADAVVVVLASAVLIVGLAPERGIVARALSAGGLVWLGRVSFSIYLLHGPLLALLGRVRLPGGAWAEAAFIVAVLLPASFLTHRFIEQPGRRLPGKLQARSRVIA